MHPYFLLALDRSGIKSNSDVKRVILGNEIQSVTPDVEVTRFSPDLNASDLEVRYKVGSPLVTFDGASLRKPLLRFDFREEWNNLGYGKTSLDPLDAFGLAGKFTFLSGEVIAEVVNSETGERICDYAWVENTGTKSILWFNRNVGPIDGYDWVVIENFFSRYRSNDRHCTPVVSEIPFGYQSAFSMRIDCDEAVVSGRQLFELYVEQKCPFGLAIKTGQSLGETDRRLMANVIEMGGSVVSHSHTHASNWGGSRESAAWEVRESHRVLRELNLPGINYDYVVSPFHQNPQYAVQGLADAGIRGFVGGIICNDPEYLMARAGHVPGVEGIISHSQQCMLHGENIREAGGSIEVYKQAFRTAVQTETFFGFLDHPFSQYWYGWESEDQRLAVHREYLEFILSHSGVWRASLVDAMRFLDMRAQVQVEANAKGYRLSLAADSRWEGLPSLRVRIRDEQYKLSPGHEVLIEA